MNFLKSFKFALSGILYCVLCERNMRIHTVVSLYVLFFSRFYNFSSVQYLLVALTIASVISTELLNTAFEKICDKLSKEKNFTIKIVKDIAAGAVLVNAMVAFIIGLVLFFQMDRIFFIYEYFIHSWVHCALLTLSLFVSIIFIMGSKCQKEKFENFLKSREENFEKD